MIKNGVWIFGAGECMLTGVLVYGWIFCMRMRTECVIYAYSDREYLLGKLQGSRLYIVARNTFLLGCLISRGHSSCVRARG